MAVAGLSEQVLQLFDLGDRVPHLEPRALALGKLGQVMSDTPHGWLLIPQPPRAW
jgi:hypothetical protein